MFSIVCLPILLIGTQDSSLFEKKNVTDFLKCFENLCEKHDLEKV